MAKNAGTTFEKRRKERKKLEKRKDKLEKKEQRKLEKENRISSEDFDEVDPDIAGIVPGPQPIIEDD